LAVSAAAGALATAIVSTVPRETTPQGDELIYERMADEPFGTHTFPFGYRIGLPLLVHILHVPHGVTFPLLAVAAIAATAGLLYATARTIGAPDLVAVAAALLFASCPGMVVTLFRDGRSVDPISLLVLAAGVLFVVRRQALALALTLLAGALVRESWVLVVPFAYAMWATRPLDPRLARTVLAVAAPASALYAAIRLGIPTIGRNQVVGYSGSFFAARWDVVTSALSDWAATLRRCFLALGPLWFVAPLAVGRVRLARAGLVWAGLLVAALAFAADWARVLLLLAPLAYPAAAFVLRRGARGAALVAAACACCNIAYLVYMIHSGHRNILHPHPPAYPVR
jgi:hypothetical protein